MELPRNVDELEDRLSEPPTALIESCAAIDGDLVVLGAGGKMGPTLARMALRAMRAAGNERRVIAVSRFATTGLAERLRSWGLEVVRADLLDEMSVQNLPDASHVMFMAGLKFGAGSAPPLTWAMNCYVPALVARRYQNSSIAAFSTGNVYPMVPPESGGSCEDDPPSPVGEYAMTALGRERTFQYFSQRYEFPLTVLRLNYAAELRYGVLVDLAQSIIAGQPIDLAMSYVNVVWQRDANAHALQALCAAGQVPQVLNIAGPEILSVRETSVQFGELLGREPKFSGEPSADALLNNAAVCHGLFGLPSLPVDQLIEFTARWLLAGGETLGKPTHFQSRDGRF